MQVILLCMAQTRLALSLPVCGGLVYMIQKVYLKTSRQLRFLELESRAAVLSSFLESVSTLLPIPSKKLPCRKAPTDMILTDDRSKAWRRYAPLDGSAKFPSRMLHG
jgi:hypothetical protein